MVTSHRMGYLAVLGCLSTPCVALAGCAADTHDPDIASSTEALVDPLAAGTKYALGGTVKGLTNAAKAGLVLGVSTSTAGAEYVTIKADGSFAFATKVASGTSYQAFVQTEPTTPAQACTIRSGGSGKVGKANVATIAVDCSAGYTVGGTVAGLAGAGFQISDNSSTVSITANGSFTFPGRLANGAAYLITPVKEPSGPVQTCEITNASGTISGKNVTNVAIACTTVENVVYVQTNQTWVNPGLSLTDAVSGRTFPITSPGETSTEYLPVGQSYSFVLAQPQAGQQCTVSPAQGTMANAPLTVNVTCAAYYPIVLDVSWPNEPCQGSVNFFDGVNSLFIAPGETGGTFADGRAAGQGYQIGFSTSDAACICTGPNGSFWNNGTLAGVDYMSAPSATVSVSCQEAIQ